MLTGSPDAIKDLQEQADKLSWYHTIDLGNGIVTPGVYDLRSLLQYYGIPESLAGKAVLDIGTASGFFAFEFERRGASVVVATDVPQEDYDLSPSERKRLFANSPPFVITRVERALPVVFAHSSIDFQTEPL